MKHEKYIFSKFTSDDEHRPQFRRPFAQGDYVWATDARLLLRVRKDLVEGEYKVLDTPSMAKVFDSVSEEGRHVELTLDAVRKGLKEIPMVNKICEDCDGDGVVEYEYQSRDDGLYFKELTCPVCDGRGYLSNVQERATDAVFEIDEALFLAYNIVAIGYAASALGLKSIEFTLAERKDVEQNEPFVRFSLGDGIDGLCIGLDPRWQNAKNPIIKLET